MIELTMKTIHEKLDKSRTLKLTLRNFRDQNASDRRFQLVRVDPHDFGRIGIEGLVGKCKVQITIALRPGT